MKLSINVPTELKDLTLGQYQKFVKIQKTNDDPTFIAQKMIEIFCNINLTDTFKIKVSDVNDIVNTLNTLFDNKAEKNNLVGFLSEESSNNIRWKLNWYHWWNS
jgi:hypothetical protein